MANAYTSTTRKYDFAGEAQVAIGASSVQSAALAEGEYCLNPTEDCFVKIASNPTAVANEGLFIPAGALFHARVSANDKVAVIQKSSAGSLLIVPSA